MVLSYSNHGKGQGARRVSQSQKNSPFPTRFKDRLTDARCSGGEEMPAPLRRFMETRFGSSFDLSEHVKSGQSRDRGRAGCERSRPSREAELEEKIAQLEAKLAKKDGIIAEISEEYVTLKKELGEP
jgi:hypothetical protein